MDRIIVVNCHKIMSAEQLNTLRKRVVEQLPAEGYIVVLAPEGVTVQEIGLGAQRVDNYDGPDIEPEATTTSPSGKPVEHVDLSGEDEPIRFVWLTREQTTEDQRLFAIGQQVKDDTPLWAIRVDQLTSEELGEYGNRVCEL